MDCLFCKIIAGEIPGDIVYEDEKVLAFNDIINPNGYVSYITLNQSQEIKKWKQNL